MITLENVLKHLEPRVNGFKRGYLTPSQYQRILVIDDVNYEMGMYIYDRFGKVDDSIYFALTNYFEKKFGANCGII